ncbi:response regulator [Corynebacterium sp. CCUG 18816]|uniref:response regulator n=1 Tax=Corynebacterium pseudogenitalium TaxID=38303 RepID=UPI002109E184|nr:response regulator [Corynebacterium pseudogenitalium]MCQ4616849.1 response regulator [Corynebacterium pseudogenitalium]
MNLTILILEDEAEVRAALERDLLPFADTVRLEVASNADEAWEVIDELSDDGDLLALALCDHRMPGTTGVEFLVQMMQDPRTAATRKVLVTGQAQLKDTVHAVNEANLDYYIAKPWDVEELHQVVRNMLTDYVEALDIDPLPYFDVLDQQRALTLTRHRD